MVIREGREQTIPAKDIVPGDLLVLSAGDRVTADGRLLAAQGLRLDLSTMTGESDPQGREPSNEQWESPVEARNVVLSGSIVAAGDALAIVTAVGPSTFVGGVASLAGGEKQKESELGQDITRLTRCLMLLAFTLAILVIVTGVAVRQEVPLEVISSATVVLVAFLPQGLPSIISLLLTAAAKRLAAQHILVKHLPSIETLGAMSVLATDKTGTLTKNQMQVESVWLDDRVVDQVDDNEALGAVLLAANYCRRARFNPADMDKPLPERRIFGDATETGLLRWVAQNGGFRPIKDRLFEVPFSSATKVQLVVHLVDEKVMLFTKGAPERVLSLCQYWRVDGRVGARATPYSAQDAALPPDFGRLLNQAYERLASLGQRVLAYAQKQLEGDGGTVFTAESLPRNGQTLLGLVGLLDPPKESVDRTVLELKRAGIRVVMITGDHPLTAEVGGRSASPHPSRPLGGRRKSSRTPEQAASHTPISRGERRQ